MSNADHKMIIVGRESLQMNGVESVLGFDENYVSLSASVGKIIIEGAQMRIENLSKETGEINIIGEISAVYFADEKTKNGVFKKLFK